MTDRFWASPSGLPNRIRWFLDRAVTSYMRYPSSKITGILGCPNFQLSRGDLRLARQRAQSAQGAATDLQRPHHQGNRGTPQLSADCSSLRCFAPGVLVHARRMLCTRKNVSSRCLEMQYAPAASLGGLSVGLLHKERRRDKLIPRSE